MMGTELPRLFRVTWTNARKNTRDPRRYDSNEAFGTQYPNGFVTLDNGASFETLGELRHFLDEHGEHCLTFLDEDEELSESGAKPVTHIHCRVIDKAMVRRFINDIAKDIRMSRGWGADA